MAQEAEIMNPAPFMRPLGSRDYGTGNGSGGMGEGHRGSREVLSLGGLLDERTRRAQQVRPYLGVQGSQRARPNP